MNETLVGLFAAAGGLVTLVADRGLTWARNRNKDDAEAERTVGQTWQTIVQELRTDIEKLRERVDSLEDELSREREQKKALTAELDRYKNIARSLLRHVIKLRDALAQAHADVPAMPPEIEDAMTSVELP